MVLGYMVLNSDFLTAKGKLRKKYAESIYMDTSVIIDYCLELEEFDKACVDYELNSAYRELFFKKKNKEEVLSGIKQSHYSHTQLKVSSPIALMEFMEKLYEQKFLTGASKYIDMKKIQKTGTKEIGDKLRAIYDGHQLTLEKSAQRKEGDIRILDRYPTCEELLFYETHVDTRWSLTHTPLVDICFLDIKFFNFSIVNYIKAVELLTCSPS